MEVEVGCGSQWDLRWQATSRSTAFLRSPASCYSHLSAGDRGGSGDDGAGDQTLGAGLIRHSRAHHSSRTDSSAGHNGRVCRCEDGDATNHDADPSDSFDDSRALW